MIERVEYDDLSNHDKAAIQRFALEEYQKLFQLRAYWKKHWGSYRIGMFVKEVTLLVQKKIKKKSTLFRWKGDYTDWLEVSPFAIGRFLWDVREEDLYEIYRR